MRVLWFTNTPSLASNQLGIEKVSGGWIESLERELVTNKDVTLGIAFYAKVNKLRFFRNNNVKYYALPKSSIFVRWLKRIIGKIDNPKKEIPKFKTIISDFNPDIIHIFGTENSFCDLIEHTSIPVLVHIQGFVHKIIEKFSIGFSNFELLKYSGILSIIKGDSPFFRKRLFKKMAMRELDYLNKIKYIDGRTAWDKSIINKHAKEAKYYKCDELIRDEFYWGKWNNSYLKVPIIISIINHNLYKGLLTIVKTSKILKDNNINFEWKIVGISENENSAKIVKKKEHCDYHNINIQLLGTKNAKFISNLMTKSSLFVLPSHIENSPNTLCEAMLIGIPIVSTNVGGVPSLLKDRTEGMLVEPFDERQSAEAIMNILGNQDNAQKYSANSRHRAQIRHNKDKILNNLLSIYTEIQKNH